MSPANILIYGYSPASTSGMATLTRHLTHHLASLGTLHIYGVQDDGNPKDPKQYPHPIYSFARRQDPDTYARNHFLSVLSGHEPHLTPPFDLIIPLMPPDILAQPTHAHPDGVITYLRHLQKEAYTKNPPDHWFKVVGVYPIQNPLDPNLIEQTIGITDYPIVISQFGADQISHHTPALSNTITILDPGIDTQVFKPLPQTKVAQFIDRYFRGQVDPSTMLITSVAKNYYLSDLTRTLHIFYHFKKIHPHSFLYLHTDAHGPFVDLEIQAKRLGLELLEDWAYSGQLSAGLTTSPQDLNLIYNASDLVISTSHASWYGFALAEAQATGTLIMAPYHSSLAEHLCPAPLTSTSLNHHTIQQLTGIPLTPDPDGSHWVTYGSADQHLIRPTISISQAVEKLVWIKNHPDQAKKIAARGRKHIQSLQQVAPSWLKTVHHALTDLHHERQNPQATITRLFS